MTAALVTLRNKPVSSPVVQRCACLRFGAYHGEHERAAIAQPSHQLTVATERHDSDVDALLDTDLHVLGSDEVEVSQETPVVMYGGDGSPCGPVRSKCLSRFRTGSPIYRPSVSRQGRKGRVRWD